MKTLLTILLSILSVTLMAQVPQGVGYQGVATDSEGIELVNQAISIRASVLSGSANGTIEWEETHATTTDDFGLFALTIGEGNNTGGGMLSGFVDIPWGESTYFLRIEMDATGGMDYSLMGVNQMMSVPYALYAESANINYDSIANYLSGDSTFVTNISNGLGGGNGCDFFYPEKNNITRIHHRFAQGSFTVPEGKHFYMISADNYSWNNVDGNQGLPSIGDGPLLFDSGDVIFDQWDNLAGRFFGYLVDASDDVTIVNHNFVNGDYIVPQGKHFYMLNEQWWGGNYDSESEFWPPTPAISTLTGFLIFESGDVLFDQNLPGLFNGYLVDEDYFDDCGGQNNSESAGSGGNPNSLIYTIDGF